VDSAVLRSGICRIADLDFDRKMPMWGWLGQERSLTFRWAEYPWSVDWKRYLESGQPNDGYSPQRQESLRRVGEIFDSDIPRAWRASGQSTPSQEKGRHQLSHERAHACVSNFLLLNYWEEGLDILYDQRSNWSWIYRSRWSIYMLLKTDRVSCLSVPGQTSYLSRKWKASFWSGRCARQHWAEVESNPQILQAGSWGTLLHIETSCRLLI